MAIADLRFLVADGDEFQRRWLTVMLSNLGARHIAEAVDGAAALMMLKRQAPRYDITFIDLKLPDMDGMELIRSLANSQEDVSMVLVSALDSSLMYSVAAMARAYGVDLLGTIEKPAAPEELQALINLYRPPVERSLRPPAPPAIGPADLQQALERAEFEPLFQPKVALQNGQVQGVEAFARWRHPVHGWISPALFVPALEALGQVDQLTWIILEKSVAALTAWRALGHDIPVSINMSSSTLAAPGFAERVASYLQQNKIDAAALIFEVTESDTVLNLPIFLENLTRLRMAGCGLSVDDFGTGHAKMQDLLRIPFSELKVDRSFVAGASLNHALEMVLQSSLDLCRKLKRLSVAVGVESKQDWDFLRDLGCDYAQGYYIAKPMDAAAIPAWLDEWAHFF